MNAANNSGCYGCGGRVIAFGGEVTPALFLFFDRRVIPGKARWWTECRKCGVVERVEVRYA